MCCISGNESYQECDQQLSNIANASNNLNNNEDDSLQSHLSNIEINKDNNEIDNASVFSCNFANVSYSLLSHENVSMTSESSTFLSFEKPLSYEDISTIQNLVMKRQY